MSSSSLASYRTKERKKRSFRELFSFLYRWDSLFYYALFVLLLGFAWIGFSLFENSFTQMLNWDTTWQYIPFAYTYHDAWRTFLSTGRFPLYDFATYIGTDSIGSNSYYGLFDPFIVALVFFPKGWIPQMMAIFTAVKVMVATLLTRSYLKYMGIKEWTARFAAIAAGFSGYVSFFVGFPSFVSAVIYVPMVLWGIEKVIRERKPGILIWALFLEGITSFFLLVCVCIFGVLYALWRYFTTLKQRSAKQNWIVIGMGISCFAVGLMLCSFTLLPSLRESSLSGRSVSIGTAYLEAVKTSLTSHDLRTFFALVFEPVGDHPGRELMGLVSFFFPTAGHVALPLTRSSYDAWTASLFTYTPCVILFFTALLESIRQKKGLHLVAVMFITYLVFTNFSYYFFYAFSGNGYGRWYLVLIPIIVYYCAWGFDQRKEAPEYIPILSGFFAIMGTLFTFFLTDKLLKGVTFSGAGWNPNHQTYWPVTYVGASEIYNGQIHNAWYLYYQLALVAIDSFLMIWGQRKKWLPKALVISVAVEAIVMGNLAYLYDGLWNYKNSFAGGERNRDTAAYVERVLSEKDSSFYRTYADAYAGTKYASKVAGLNGSADFHSLMNFDVEQFALNNHMKYPGSVINSYQTEGIYNPSWSGYYGNKREGTDLMLGYRYYQISNSYSQWKNEDGSAFFPTANVPFGAEEIVEASKNRDLSRVYGVPEECRPSLGWAVDSNYLYALTPVKDDFYRTNFYTPAWRRDGFVQLLRAEKAQQKGAIVAHDETLPEGFNVRKDVPDIPSSEILSLTSRNIKATYYTVGDGDLMIPSQKHSYYNEGLGFFLKHFKTKKENIVSSFNETLNPIERDTGMLAFSPVSGQYFNPGEEGNPSKGLYVEIKYANDYYANKTSDGRYQLVPRIYLLGDTEDGKTNQLLSFEYNCFDNARRVEGSHSYYNSRYSTFGLYAKGRVTNIVFCWPGSGTMGMNVDAYFHMTTYEQWEKQNNARQADKLQNVTYDTNVFSFDTSYSEDRIVVTQLGYDKGWQATAFLPNGEKQDCRMVKLDGGLVGFIAPHVLDEEGKPLSIHYELRYMTPGSNLAAILWGIGTTAFSGYLIYTFVTSVKDEKKKLVLESQDEPEA
ncbi:MAG: YfhO family protein [Candidatus Enteromonas sp.]